MPGKISVIIPVYNHTNALLLSLASLFNQTYTNFEVIVVDDGSEENLESLIFSLQPSSQGNKPIINFIKQKHLGAAAARNRGLVEAKGDYVIFWDADTIARPEMLESLERQLSSHLNAGYAYSNYKFGFKTMYARPFDADELKKNNYIDTTSLIRRNSIPSSPPPLCGVPFVAGQGGREVLAQGPFDENLKRFQDWDLWLTLLEKNIKGIYVPQTLFKKITKGRKGYSYWLPSFAYKLFKNFKRVQQYEAAKKIVLFKHHLI